MTQVFISYSRSDMEFVQQLAMDLHGAGLDVWWDLSDIQGSDVWERKIEEGLGSSEYFIVVLTPDSLQSRWVRREYLSADNKAIKIIPLRLKPCDEVPLTLRDIQPINAIDRPYADVLSDVLKIVPEKTNNKVSHTPVDRTMRPTTLADMESKKADPLELTGTITLLSFFLFVSFELLSASSDELKALAALSGLAAGYFLLRGRKLPNGILFKASISFFFLTYDFLLLNDNMGWDIQGVEIIAGIASILLAAVIIVSMKTSKVTSLFAAIFLSIFILLVSVNLGLNALSNYPSWPQIPSIVISVIAAVLIWMDV